MNIMKQPLLTADEEKELALLCLKGDVKAKQKFISANLRLVAKFAKKYSYGDTERFNDLFQEGVIGLTDAVRKFDPTKGKRFATYACFWIKNYMYKFIQKSGSVVRDRHNHNQRPKDFSLDKRYSNDENSKTYGELLPDESPTPEEIVSQRELAHLVRIERGLLADNLSPSNRKVLDGRFALEDEEPKTLKQIGISCGCSRQ